ncbi:MAG: ABC transporter permease [Bacteroidales bacterium]|nr:ABC transporter permease [Bacteroidales bacterium]
MFKNYLKIAIRNLVKRKFYSLINISGLAIGLASFIIIMLYIIDELSYDRYHKNAENIYRLVNVHDFNGVGENSASSPFPVAFTLKDEYPGIVKNVVRIFNFQAPRCLIEFGENKFNERNFFFADSTFFNIFDYEFVRGDPNTVFDEPYSLVLTESIAKKYFGDDDPLNKTIKFDTKFDLKVTGIIKDVPAQSHFNFDFISSMSSVRKIYGGKLPQTWVWNPCWTYLLLEKGTARLLEEKFPDFIDKFFYDAEKENISLYLQPLTDIHLKSKLDYELEPNNNISYIYILSVIAAFLLIIASINFMNLATATSASRAKEIGVKKVVGVNRSQIIFQFISESIILSFIALIIALILIELILPVFNTFTNKDIILSILLQPEYLLTLIALVIFTGVFSGIYPAFYLSAFKPLSIIKGNFKNENKSTLPRKILVIVQFVISITLIIGTLTIFNQLKYLRNADLGFNKEQIIIIPINHTPIANTYKNFKSELLLNPDIISVTAVDDIFGVAHNTHEFRPEGLPQDKWQFYPALVVRYDFVKTFDIKILAGRDYNEKNKTDPEKGMLINEAMVRHLGWRSNDEAIGKKFKSLNGEERVIGVTNNFNVTSMHESAGPFVLNIKEKPREVMWFLKFMAIRIAPDKHKKIIAFIETKWKEFAPDRPFEYSFLDQELSKLYKDEDNLGNFSLIFTLLIIFIASLGLFGLVSFMAEQRTKEIGIRKVLGANVANIIILLSKEFIKLILIAIIIAWPIAFLLIDEWLNHFAYRTDINWFVFILAGLFALIIVLLITAYKAYIASRTNPVDTLKYE